MAAGGTISQTDINLYCALQEVGHNPPLLNSGLCQLSPFPKALFGTGSAGDSQEERLQTGSC